MPRTSPSAASVAWTRTGGPRPRELQAFLTQRGLEVTDVTRGVARGTRRLLVGDHKRSRSSYVVSVATTTEGAPKVEAEARHLTELRQRVRPAVGDTLSSVVERVDVSGMPAIVLSAVPGMAPGSSTVPRGFAAGNGAVLAWLTMLWSDTSGPAAPVDFGSAAYDALLSRFAGSPRAATTLGALQRSRSALGERDLARTVSHGCLCPRHLFVSDGRAIGAEDWGRSRFGADPLRDLGTWVVRGAGPGIGDVFSGRSAQGRTLRDFVGGGLAYWGLSSRLWRDVLVLALAEAAVEGLEDQDTTAMDLLTAVSDGLTRTATRGRTRR